MHLVALSLDIKPRYQVGATIHILLGPDPGGMLRLSILELSNCNQSLNLCCSSYSTSFLVTLSVHPSLPFCPSGCHCVTIITYIPVVSFLVETGQGRLSVPGHIHQRQTLIGLWCNLLYGQDELGYLFPSLQHSPALSRPSETQQEKQPLDLMGSTATSHQIHCPV